MKEASKQGWGESITQLKDWLIFNLDDSAGTKWDIMNNALADAQRRQLALKLWVAATAFLP